MPKESKQKGEKIRLFIFDYVYKKELNQKYQVDKAIDSIGEYKKVCKREGAQIFSKMSETKAAFAEGATRFLRKILYCYMEEYGYKNIHKITAVVTTLNSGRNCSIDSIPKNVNCSDFLSIHNSKSLREIGKPDFKNGDRVFISKNNLHFRKGYRPQHTQDVFEIIAISSRKLPTCTIMDEQEDIIHGKFLRKELTKII